MKLNLLLLSSVIATGCGGGPSEDEFGDEAAKVVCAKMFECFDDATLSAMYADEDACREDLSSQYEPGEESTCDYDAGAAQDCLDAFEDTSCDDLMAGNSPSECDADQVCPS